MVIPFSGPSGPSVANFEGRIMAITREQVILLITEKVGPGVAIEAKMEKGFWRITLTKEGKTSLLELKRGFLEDYLDRGEYQQEIAFESRINKALKGLT